MTTIFSYFGLRRIRHSLKTLMLIMIICLGFLLVPKPALAFDTGDHSDLTWQALKNEGFQDTPTQIVQLENWITDYYSSAVKGTPTYPIKLEVEKLHFDDLFTTEQIRRYWGWLTFNTKSAVQQATRDKDALKLLTLLGISLHAVQDFYAHSNWVETHPRSPSSPFKPETWFDSPPGSSSPQLYTGYYKHDEGPATKPPGAVDHGDYDTGLNKDSYYRQLKSKDWQTAYVFAYAGSRQWVQAIRTWVNEVDPTFWSSVQTATLGTSDRKALDKDLNAAYRISEWVALQGADGHWKGKGSGSTSEFLAFTASWTASSDSRFVNEFKERKLHLLLSKGLNVDGAKIGTPPSPLPTVSTLAPLNQKAIIVRTLQAKEDSVGFFEVKIDPGGKADFYGKLTVAGQTFVEAMQLDKADVSPAWTTIKFVPSTTTQVSSRYELWDEDGGASGDDDHCDINSAKNKRDLNWNFNVSSHNNTGDITGVHDSPANALTSKGSGDSDRAIIKLYVTERSL